ncbi:hypothetical protein D3C87_1314910 [compost metagenome]
MCRHIDFGNDIYPICFSEFLKGYEFLLGIMPVLCRQIGVRSAFQPESCLYLVPVVIEINRKPVIIQVNVEFTHFVIGHHLYIASQKIYCKKLPTYIQDKAPYLILRIVTGNTNR